MTLEQIAAIADVVEDFPHLTAADWELTSPVNPFYNCIAWAASDTSQWWWPANDAYWPEHVERSDALAAFKRVFRDLDYGDCDNAGDTQIRERIAIFVRDNSVTHVARQLESGRWTSKLGQSVDIRHDLKDLEGECYGRVVAFMCRPRRPG